MYLLKPSFPKPSSFMHLHLHSTMYLLKLINAELGLCVVHLFTFHYVSIKTKPERVVRVWTIQFTFHYVSIKTCRRRILLQIQRKFTFHYVSIKTNRLYKHLYLVIYLHSTMYLLKLRQMKNWQQHKQIYIPLCIY